MAVYMTLIWEAFTSHSKEKRTLAVYKTLIGEAKETVLNMEINELTG